MAVLGRKLFGFNKVQDQTYELEPFDPSIGTYKQVLIIDYAIVYDFPYSHKTYLLIFCNEVSSNQKPVVYRHIIHNRKVSINMWKKCTQIFVSDKVLISI